MSPNNFKHRFRPQQHIIIPEAQYAIAARLDHPRPRIIVFACIQVLSTIELDDELRRDTDKIHDVFSDRVLATEFMIRQMLVSEVMPQATFGIGRCVTQFTCTVPFFSHRAFPWLCREIVLPHPSPPLRSRGGSDSLSGCDLRENQLPTTFDTHVLARQRIDPHAGAHFHAAALIFHLHISTATQHMHKPQPPGA